MLVVDILWYMTKDMHVVREKFAFKLTLYGTGFLVYINYTEAVQ